MLLSLLLFALAGFGADDAVKGDYYVSPDGNDTNAGSLEAPFATLEAARDAVRAKLGEGRKKDISVLLREGTYAITAPVAFGPADSGRENVRVTYKAYPGETVTISGGRTISGWEKAEGDKWTVTLDAVASGDWHFRQLFRDGERLPRGRFPDAPKMMRVAGVSEDLTGIVLDASPPVENLEGSHAELVMYQNWSISRVTISSSNDRTLKLTDPMGWVGHGDATSASTNKPTYIENALAFVDRPGEWYLDESSGVLTYQAEKGEDPNERQFVAPVAEQLIAVTGVAETPVRNLHFEGIDFAHTRWDLPEFGYRGIQAGHYGTTIKEPTFVLPLAITFLYAQNCSITGSHIRQTGASGIGLGAGCRDNRITQCTLSDIGGSGIMVGWRGAASLEQSSADEDSFLSADWARPEDVPSGNRVMRNLVERCGAVNHGCVGIFDAFSEGTQIAYNVVRDLPYTGISSGFRWNETETSQRGGLIAYNHVYDVMKTLADGGCLYTLGFQPGARIIGNVFHDVHRSALAHGGAPNNGIFFDEGSKGFHVEHNTIHTTSGESIRFNQTTRENMTWEDNRFGIGAELR